jgi:hypothetical protein
MTFPKERTLSPLGARIMRAIEEAGRSQTSTERGLGFSQGWLSRVVRGQRADSTLDVRNMQALADYLEVNFEWLVLGRGPMRKERPEIASPAEIAIHLARSSGVREDAIRSACVRLGQGTSELTAMDWALAIDAEARLLDRAGVPPDSESSDRVTGETPSAPSAMRRTQT